MGFITFDALCRPVTQIPPNGDTCFVEDLTLAVSRAAGTAVIVAAKRGLKARAVGGVSYDDMGDWMLMKLAKFGIDTSLMVRCDGFTTSSSLVTARHKSVLRLIWFTGSNAKRNMPSAGNVLV